MISLHKSLEEDCLKVQVKPHGVELRSCGKKIPFCQEMRVLERFRTLEHILPEELLSCSLA